MMIDGKKVDKNSIHQSDICIIGAGPAGISLAKEFESSSLSLCLVESGGLELDFDNQALAAGESVGQKYYDLDTTRLRVFGGTSLHWSGWCRPLDDIDFKKRDWVADSGWPIGLDDLQEYYQRSQPLFQLGDFKYLPQDWDFSQAPPLDFQDSKLVNRLIHFSPPTKFGEHYRESLTKAKNIKVFLNSNVASINANQDGSHVTDIAIKCLGGNEFKIKAKYFVVAAGGLENARLLLLSNNVNKAGLGNSNDVVGRYFTNHIFLDTGGFILPDSRTNDKFYISRSTVSDAQKREVSVRGYVNFKAQAQQLAQMLNVSFNIHSSDISSVFLKDEHDDKWYSDIARVVSNMDELARGAFNRLHAKFDPEEKENIYKLINIAEQSPNRDSRVGLSDKLDPLGQPQLKLDWRLQELDLLSIERAHKVFGAELARLGIGRFVNPLEASEGWPAEYLGDWHHMGTTRMHNSPKLGVVDSNCKLHDVDNCFIAGSSVFPTSGCSNPTLTIVALALRLADHIKAKIG